MELTAFWTATVSFPQRACLEWDYPTRWTDVAVWQADPGTFVLLFPRLLSNFATVMNHHVNAQYARYQTCDPCERVPRPPKWSQPHHLHLRPWQRGCGLIHCEALSNLLEVRKGHWQALSPCIHTKLTGEPQSARFFLPLIEGGKQNNPKTITLKILRELF